MVFYPHSSAGRLFACRSHKAQRKLPVPICVAVNEALKMVGHVRQLQIAAQLDFFGNVLRDVASPASDYIEAHHPNRISVLAIE